MTLYAMLSSEHDRVQCGRCGAPFGTLEAGPAAVPLMERGGPVVDVQQIGASERRLVLLEGYLPREPDGVWVLTNYARKRVLRHGRPRFSHGQGGNGVAEYPARIECWRCLAVSTVEPRRLGF